MNTAIEFRHIRKSYGNTVIVPDLNLKIEKGEFVTIIGSSGCGKTTALKMINGLIPPTSGDILVNGENIRNKDMIALRRGIGYAIQGSVLFPNMTVEQNISYVPSLLNKKDKERTAKAVDKWMQIIGLDPSMKDILLMDEPFGAVDEITREQLQNELKEIHKKTGITILFVTHDIEEALKLGTKVLVMDHGEIQQYGTPKELLQNPAKDCEYCGAACGKAAV